MTDMFLKNIPWIVWGMLLMVLVGTIIKIVKLRSARKNPQPTDEELDALEFSQQQDRQEEEDSRPKCPCGAMATHPAPRLIRKRSGFLRSYFAMPPSYKRDVPKVHQLWDATGEPETDVPLVFCETHAHVADSMMDRFIFERIRAVQADANEKIAIEAAGFELEGLLSKVKDTLTESQRRSVRKTVSPLRVLPKNGTDDVPVSETN